ncbi:MAG: hypothetical protein LBD53_02370 [Tannerella sp.]|jgi:hypothetical protein|nr:hypothetical protein [Tannerella sp.]
MKTRENNIRWGLAFVRKTLLPAEGTWTEVPYYTYEINGDRSTYYKAQCKDFPIDLKAIESYPILESFVACNYEIRPDQSVFIDWIGNYFIGKEDCFNIQPENITIIYREPNIPRFAWLDVILLRTYNNFQNTINGTEKIWFWKNISCLTCLIHKAKFLFKKSQIFK